MTDQKAVWDSIASKWNEYRAVPSVSFTELIRKIKLEGKVLDLGCGGGRNFIKTDSVKWYGIDFSGEQLKYARQRAQKMNLDFELTEARVTDIPYHDCFFDMALYVATIHCLSGDEREKSLSELFRVVKKGSKVLITSWYSPKLRGEKNLVWTKDESKIPRYTYFFSQKEFEELVRSAGFEILYSGKEFSDRARWNNLVIVAKKP
jgi:tRNA (uracil-5-)-methyltransferase TRM9